MEENKTQNTDAKEQLKQDLSDAADKAGEALKSAAKLVSDKANLPESYDATLLWGLCALIFTVGYTVSGWNWLMKVLYLLLALCCGIVALCKKRSLFNLLWLALLLLSLLTAPLRILF